MALRLADAMMTRPGDISAQLALDVRQHFSRDEIVELTLDVMKWNYQKVSVALGIDVAVNPNTLTALSFDANGAAVFG